MVAQKTKEGAMYTVACQKKKGDDLFVYKVKESNRSELFDFIKRVLMLDSLTAAEFLEVHEEMHDGTGVRVVYGDPRAAWPTGVQVVYQQGILARKPEPLEKEETKSPAPVTVVGLVVSELHDKVVAMLRPRTIKVA